MFPLLWSFLYEYQWMYTWITKCQWILLQNWSNKKIPQKISHKNIPLSENPHKKCPTKKIHIIFIIQNIQCRGACNIFVARHTKSRWRSTQKVEKSHKKTHTHFLGPLHHRAFENTMAPTYVTSCYTMLVHVHF